MGSDSKLRDSSSSLLEAAAVARLDLDDLGQCIDGLFERPASREGVISSV
jgi:hypothetical protein